MRAAALLHGLLNGFRSSLLNGLLNGLLVVALSHGPLAGWPAVCQRLGPHIQHFL